MTVSNPILHHINLKTLRMQEMIDWYGFVVGMRPNFHQGGIAFLTNDTANHRLALISSPKITDDPDKLAHTGMHHLAFEYPDCGDLLATFSRLKAKDILPHMSLDHGLTMSFYYVDPDGNSVELQYDNFGDWARSTEWMRTSQDFIKNPIGVPVDPQKMVDAHAKGAGRDELHRRAFAGEFADPNPLDLRMPI